MAQGGPYTEEARYGFDPALAQAAATDPAMAVVGAPNGTDTTTRRTPRVQPASNLMEQQFNVGIDAPAYGWSLDQNDLGQGQVQQIRTDNFVTPVAEQKLPFGAIAARQQATSIRRQKLEDAKAQAIKDFDPYKDISDPAAQHSYAFSNYLNKSAWPTFIQGIQDGLGTTREGAIDYIANNPEGRMMARQWSKQQDSIAKESAGMTKRSLDTLARIAEGKTELPKEDQEALVRYVENADENDIPQQGKDPREFLGLARGANEAMSLMQFQDQFLNDFDKFAQQRIELGKAKRLPGGRYEMTDEEWQQFGPYKEAMTEQAVQLGIKGGNREAIQEHLDKLIQNRVERKTRGWDAPRPTEPKGDGIKEDQRVVLSTEDLPWNPDKGSIRDMAGSAGVGAKGDTPLKNLDPRKGESSKAVRLMTKLGRNLPATVFVNSDGDNEKIIPLYIQKDPVFPTRRYIVGESATDSDTRADVEKVDSETGEVTTTTGKVVKKGFVRVPVEGNEKLLDTLTQGQDWSTLLDSPGRATQSTPSGGSQGKKTISGF